MERTKIEPELTLRQVINEHNNNWRYVDILTNIMMTIARSDLCWLEICVDNHYNSWASPIILLIFGARATKAIQLDDSCRILVLVPRAAR